MRARASAAWVLFGLVVACSGPAGPADSGPDALGEGGDEAGDAADDADVGPDGAADEGTDVEPDADVEPDVETDSEDIDDADAEDDGGAGDPPLFDLEAIRDVAAADCTFTDSRTAMEGLTTLDVWSLAYNSIEVVDGEPRTIRMKGFAARPTGATGLPGVVLAHGLGGYAQERQATGLAATLGMFVIAFTGPGGGTEPENTSEGIPAGFDDGRRMFDTVPDRRGSWFWAHAVAAMRAVTCLESRGDVDPERLGMTGFSAGGVVTLISAGADDRIKAAVPLSGTLRWEVAVESPQAWQRSLLATAGYGTTSEQWLRLVEWLDADHLLDATAADVLMVDGSCDEFFPLTAFQATYGALGPGEHRVSLAANFDHGCYSLTGVEDADTIEARATVHAEGGQRAWFRHVFGTDARYAYMPVTPVISVTPMAAATYVSALVDGGGARLSVEEVRVWMSSDNAVLFASDTLDDLGSGLYGKLVPVTLEANTIVYVDVEYRTDDLVFPERFAISTEPQIPAGLVPAIRDISTCLPP